MTKNQPKKLNKTMKKEIQEKFLDIIEENLIRQIQKIMNGAGKPISKEQAEILLSKVGQRIIIKILKNENTQKTNKTK